MESDIEFLQNLFKRFVPATVYAKQNGKLGKKPLFTGWLEITAAQSAELARHVKYKEGPFFFLTGSTTKYITVDIDRLNHERADHKGKVDGVAYWDEQFPDPEHLNTLIIKTPTGGYHLVYKYQQDVNSGELEKDVLIDILSDNKAMCFAPGLYEIVNRVQPNTPPEKLVHMIINNGNMNLGITNSGTNNFTTNNNSHYTSTINNILGIKDEVQWKVIDRDGGYRLIPKDNRCCVVPGKTHSEEEHSCIFVKGQSVVANCYSHSKRRITGVASKRLRALCYQDTNAAADILTVLERILDFTEAGWLVREAGYVLRPIKDTRAYEQMCTYEEFIREQLKNNSYMLAHPLQYRDIEVFMKRHNDKRFPFVVRDKRYIGFKNGCLDLVGGELQSYDTLSDGVIPRHYVDQICHTYVLDTPLFDSIVKHQLGSDDVYEMFLALIGRLFYDVKQFDNLDIMPLIVGDTNTGKSTIIDIIRDMFAPDKIGVLDSNHETMFGMQSMHGCEVIVASEISDKLSVQLSSDVFKKMICGELVNVPKKFGHAAVVQWTAPMFMCGNDYPGFNDSRGSISKRLAIFRFDRYVQDKDDTLRSRIKQQELQAIVIKSLTAYRALLQYMDGKAFWDMCPDYFRNNRDEMSEHTDYVYMFLTLGPEGNSWANKVMYFLKVKDSWMLLEEFKRKFMNYMRFKHPNVKYKWKGDYSAFKRLGYDVVNTQICKSCLAEAHSGCCAQYDHANRSTRYVIKDILCVERELHQQ